ncbi:putative protein tag-52 [Leptopilina boulardi]|uniref:putative protein tag-52 n=1 Tax=Leptopilina boulardi TaxID=63433 RepID=UPI0021F594C6|nr:putative protein tag-52 [Leptopilina boulardi]
MFSPRTPNSSLSAELRDVISKRNILTTRTRMKVLSALDEMQNQTVNRKRESLRSQAIQEILSSEVTYLRNLEIIMEYFMHPIYQRQLLCYSSYTTLFENIETLYNVNAELLKELKQDPENVASAFCKLAPFFKLYSVYAYNYKRALELLQEIQQNDVKTTEFIASQETRPEVGNKLSSLLITPIQRVPRYKLLLKEVLRHTAPKEKNYNMLQSSLAQIENVASHINSLVEEYEDTQKLLELQKHIVGSMNLVKPGRKLIRQGPLMKVSRKGNSSFKRHFVLLSDTLLYCKGDPEGSLTICCLLPLNKCKVERVLSNGLFRVVCMQETLFLYSENGDSEAWIISLQESVKKYLDCRQTLRKDSSSRIPLRDKNQFPSENILTRRYKRKRGMEREETQSSKAKIIYVNRDAETDASSEGMLNCLFSCKKLKTTIKSDDMTMNEKIKIWMEGLKLRQTNYGETIPEIAGTNSLSTVEENPSSTGYSNEAFNSHMDEDSLMIDENSRNFSNSDENLDTQFYAKKFNVYSGSEVILSRQQQQQQRRRQRRILSFTKISNFISNVGTSLCKFFKRN